MIKHGLQNVSAAFILLLVSGSSWPAEARQAFFQIRVATADVVGPCRAAAPPFPAEPNSQWWLYEFFNGGSLQQCTITFTTGTEIRIRKNNAPGWDYYEFANLPPGTRLLNVFLTTGTNSTRAPVACFLSVPVLSLCLPAGPASYTVPGEPQLQSLFEMQFILNAFGNVINTYKHGTIDWWFVQGNVDVPDDTSLRIRGGISENDSSPTLLPTAGVTLPTTARVPLGAAVAFQALDGSGAPVSASFTVASTTLQPNVHAKALFAGQVLYRYPGSTASMATFQAVHLGSSEVSVTSGTVTKTLTVIVERPSSLGDDNSALVADIVDTAHTTGVPPQFIRAHVEQESRTNRTAYRYEPIGPTYGDLYFASRREDGAPVRVVEPFSRVRLAFEADAIDIARPQGGDLLPTVRDLRASFRIECDANGVGGSSIGAGPRDPNPTAQEIFRCNDNTQPGRQNWKKEARAAGPAREALLLGDTFTAQTAIAASYGLLQIMYGRAIEAEWTALNGSRDPSLLFDPPGAAARGEGSLVAGTFLIRNSLLQRGRRLVTTFAPTSSSNMLLRFVRPWQEYNPGSQAYGQSVAVRVPLFPARSSVPILAE